MSMVTKVSWVFFNANCELIYFELIRYLWGIIEPQAFLTMPFNMYNEENCISVSSKSHTTGWRPAVRNLARLWAAVATDVMAVGRSDQGKVQPWRPLHSLQRYTNWPSAGCDDWQNGKHTYSTMIGETLSCHRPPWVADSYHTERHPEKRGQIL